MDQMIKMYTLMVDVLDPETCQPELNFRFYTPDEYQEFVDDFAESFADLSCGDMYVLFDGKLPSMEVSLQLAYAQLLRDAGLESALSLER